MTNVTVPTVNEIRSAAASGLHAIEELGHDAKERLAHLAEVGTDVMHHLDRVAHSGRTRTRKRRVSRVVVLVAAAVAVVIILRRRAASKASTTTEPQPDAAPITIADAASRRSAVRGV